MGTALKTITFEHKPMRLLETKLSSVCLFVLLAICINWWLVESAKPLQTNVVTNLVRQVCANKKVAIESVNKMKQIIWVSHHDPSLCHKNYLAAFNELDPILSVNNNNQRCSQEYIDLIRDYHFRFIAPPGSAKREIGGKAIRIKRRQLHPEPYKYSINLDEFGHVLSIPIAIRHFFLSFVLQVSGVCKKSMLANLKSAEVEEKLRHDDRSVLNLLNTGSSLNGLLANDLARVDFDNVLYLREFDHETTEIILSHLRPELKVVSKELYFITRLEQNRALYDIMLDCRNHLQPIYQRLIMPIVILSKLGYDYLGDHLSDKEKSQLEESYIKSWLGVVHFCEMFHNMLLIGAEEAKHIASELDNKVNLGDTPEGSRLALEELELRQISEKQAEELESSPYLELPEVEAYEPSVEEEPFGNSLWILGESLLDLELSKKPGNSHPFGWRGYLRKMSRRLKSQFGKLDFNRFAHFRRHSKFYHALVNIISILSNMASISVTITFMVI